MSDWTDSLQPASFRGVPFGVKTSPKHFGRRLAVHEYPYRELAWIEDMGKKTRRVGVVGFLVANSLVYGGGDAIAQQEKLIAAAETKGSGKLVHPTLGELTVSCEDLTITDNWETGGYFAIEFSFIEDGGKLFPTADADTAADSDDAADDTDDAADDDFDDDAAPLLDGGAVVAQSALATVAGFVGEVQGLAQDATSVLNLAAGLTGNFGRFFNGALAGALGLIQPSLYAAATTVADLIGLAAAAQGAVTVAADATLATAGNLGAGAVSNTPADLAASAQTLVARLAASCANPADSLRLLSRLAAYAPAGVAASTPIGGAVIRLFQRAACAALVRAAAAYQPASYDDANAVRLSVAAVLDVQIAVAGDRGDDASFTALRAARVAVVQDLGARGASLARMATVNSAEPTPSLVLAQRLYRDPSRADELVAEADCIHPLFLPTSFKALAA